MSDRGGLIPAWHNVCLRNAPAKRPPVRVGSDLVRMSTTVRDLLCCTAGLCLCLAAATSAAADRLVRVGAAQREVSSDPIIAALDAGDGQRAIELLEDRTLNVEASQRPLLEGRACLLLGDFTKARRLLSEAIQASPAAADRQYWLGRAYSAERAFSLAARQYEKAERLGLRSAELQFHWAQALRETGRLLGDLHQETLVSTSAAGVQPGTILDDRVVLQPVEDHADTYVLAGRNSALYRSCLAVRLNPADGEIQSLAGDVWAALKRNAQASAAYEKAVALLTDPGAIERCRAAWAEMLIDVGDVEGYLRQCSHMAKTSGDAGGKQMAECYAKAAAAAARQGDIQKQIRYLTLSAELEADIDQLIRLSDALTTVQRVAEANACLDKALQRGPSAAQRRRIESRQRGGPFASPR